MLPLFGADDSVGLDWSLRICISTQLSGDAAAAVPVTSLVEVPFDFGMKYNGKCPAEIVTVAREP